MEYCWRGQRTKENCVQSSFDISIWSVARKAIDSWMSLQIDERHPLIESHMEWSGFRCQMTFVFVECLRSLQVLHNVLWSQKPRKCRRTYLNIPDVTSHDCVSWCQLAHSEINRQIPRPLLPQLLLSTCVQQRGHESAPKLVVLQVTRVCYERNDQGSVL